MDVLSQLPPVPVIDEGVEELTGDGLQQLMGAAVSRREGRGGEGRGVCVLSIRMSPSDAVEAHSCIDKSTALSNL